MDVGDHVQRGIDEGWITPPADRGPLPPAPQRVPADITVTEMMVEDRGE